MKVDLHSNMITHISEIPCETSLIRPSAICMNEQLYVFDLYSPQQAIFVYDIRWDRWHNRIVQSAKKDKRQTN